MIAFILLLDCLAGSTPLLKLGIYEDLRSRIRSRSPHYLCLVAIVPGDLDRGDEENIVGTVDIAVRSHFSCSTRSASYPYISNLAVKNYYRRQGIGCKLLLRCEQTALDWGFKTIYLHVLENNHPAKQLYFSSGYRLDRIEYSLIGCLLNHPRRLLLNKQIHETG